MKQLIRITAYNDYLLQAKNGGGGALDCLGNNEGVWQTFTMSTVDAAATAIGNGSKIRLKAAMGQTVRALPDGKLAADVTGEMVRGPLTGQRRPRKMLNLGNPTQMLDIPRIPVITVPPLQIIGATSLTVVMAPGEGDNLQHLTRFGLKTANGKFLSVEPNGCLAANKDSLTETEIFLVRFYPEPINAAMNLTIRCPDGRQFLTAVDGGGDVLATSTDEPPLDDAIFELLAANRKGQGFPDGAQVCLHSPTRQFFLTAANGGGSTISFTSLRRGASETFTLKLAGGAASLKKNGLFGLETKNGHFVSVIGKQVVASATTMGQLETLKFTDKLEAVQEPAGTIGSTSVTIKASAPEPHTATRQETQENPEPSTTCFVRTVDVFERYPEALLLDTTGGKVYVGALVDGLHWVNGEYAIVPDRRSPLTIRSDLPYQNLSEDVQDPNYNSISTAVARIRQRSLNQPLPPDATLDIEEISSEEDLRLHMQGSIDSGVHKVAANFDFSSVSKTNKVLMKFFQVFYRINIVFPPSPNDVFLSKRLPLPDEMIINSIAYGRAVYCLIESTETAKNITAALEYVYNGGVQASASASVKYENLLNSSRIYKVVLGGNFANAMEWMAGTKADGLRDLIVPKSFVLTQDLVPVPLSYSMCFLDPHFTAGQICLSTTTTIRRCVKTTGTIRVTNCVLKCTKVSDGGWTDDAEFKGKIKITAGIEGGATVASQSIDVGFAKMYANDTKTFPFSLQAEFPEWDRVQDYAYICIEPDGLLEDDDVFGGADDVIGGGEKFYLKDIQADMNATGAAIDRIAPFSGDGNELELHYRLTFM